MTKFLLECPPEATAQDYRRCTTEEIQKLSAKLKSNKAPGSDGITNLTIKNFPPEAVDFLAEIFNACMELQYFPESWKDAKVIVFPKAGKPLKDPANYRPISLLSGLSKLLERVVLTRLNDFATTKNLLLKQQFGFKKGHSTNHQLLRVVDIISHGFNIRKSTGIVFLDVAKAFDRVWHKGLLHKMAMLHFPTYLVKLTASYLEGRTFHVSMREETSTTRPIQAGVPQGSILGPFLFNIFTNDVPTDLHKTDLALYADDAAIISQSWSEEELVRNLQTALDKLAGWYDDWQIALNTSKTTATLFSRKKRLTQHPKLCLNEEEVKWEPNSSYLGVVLNHRLDWRPHIEKTQQKASAKLAALYPLLCSRSMPIESKVRVIKTIIRPTLTYASPVWSGCPEHHRSALQRVQNKALKIASGAPLLTRMTDLHRQLDIEMLDEHLRKINQNFYLNLDQNGNPLIRKLASISASPHDRYPRPITALAL